MQPQSWALLRAASTIYEDASVLVLNKPPGLSVTGERHDTDIVTLAREAGEDLYPAHRIDKVTSGLVVLARSLAAHGGITRQFNPAVARRPGHRPVGKVYLAVVDADGGSDGGGSDSGSGGGSGRGPVGLPDAGTVDLPLGPGRKGRIRVAAPREAIRFDGAGSCWSVPPGEVTVGKSVYPSVTTFVTLAAGGGRQLLAVTPVTGRRHQIRVHLAWIGHAVVGDPLFEREPAGRTLLHAWRLSLDATWADGRRLDLTAPPDPSFLAEVPGLDDDVLGSAGTTDALTRLASLTAAAGPGVGGPDRKPRRHRPA